MSGSGGMAHRREERNCPPIRHGLIQLHCDDIMPLSSAAQRFAQHEGHGSHLASLLSLCHLTSLARASVQAARVSLPRTKHMQVKWTWDARVKKLNKLQHTEGIQRCQRVDS